MAALHISWAILNVVVLVGVFIIAYRGYQTFSERFGCLPSGLLLLVLVSTCRSSDDSKKNRQGVETFSETVFVPAAQPVKAIKRDAVFYDGGVLTLTHTLNLYPASHPDSVRLFSTVYTNGLSAGTRWTPLQTSVELQPNQRLRYRAAGILKWCLLGLPVYDQYQGINGEVALRDAPVH